MTGVVLYPGRLRVHSRALKNRRFVHGLGQKHVHGYDFTFYALVDSTHAAIAAMHLKIRFVPDFCRKHVHGRPVVSAYTAVMRCIALKITPKIRARVASVLACRKPHNATMHRSVHFVHDLGRKYVHGLGYMHSDKRYHVTELPREYDTIAGYSIFGEHKFSDSCAGKYSIFNRHLIFRSKLVIVALISFVFSKQATRHGVSAHMLRPRTTTIKIYSPLFISRRPP